MLVGGEVGGLAGAFEAVDDEVIGLDGEVPEVEVEGAELDLAAGSVFKHADDFLADAALEVRRGAIPGEAGEQENEQQDERAGEPGEAAGDLAGKGAVRDRLRIFRVKDFAHGATSSGRMMRTEPCALSCRSQSSSRALTRCWSRTSEMRSEMVSSGGALTFCSAYSGRRLVS